MAQTITRILVPIDFSAHSDRALLYATALASRFGATLELLHVVDDPFLSGAWGNEVFVPDLTELMKGVVADAQGRLAELMKPVAAQGIKTETIVLTGRPAHTITEDARARGCDLIVMGTHGRTGLSHAVLGSVAEGVVRRAPCPVVTMRDTPPGTIAEEGQAPHGV